MTVLLVGAAEQQELTLLADAVEDLDHKVITCDTQKWPGKSPLTIIPGSDNATIESEIDYENVTGAYIISHHLFHPYDPRFGDELNKDSFSVLNQLREYQGMFESLCKILEFHDTNVVPPLQNHYWQRRKPWHLQLYKNNSIPTPDTIFTNDPDEVQKFYKKHERVIYKAVTRGGIPHELVDDDLTKDRLGNLATAPVQFQEYIQGDDLRIYILDGDVIGASRYESKNFSFKIDMDKGIGEDINIHAVTLSEDTINTVIQAVEQAGLVFAAADVRRQPDGSHVLLELNEAPGFATTDIQADQNISGKLAEFLSG